MTYDFFETIAPMIAAVLIICIVYAVVDVTRSKRKHLQELKRRKRIYRQIVKINRQLLEMGMGSEEIMEFWEGCQAEALIQYNLPPCRCKDVNECEVWCGGKARFTMNPPDE